MPAPVRNAWYVAAWSSDIGECKPFGMRILDEPIVIWRNAAGNVSALEDRCVHRLAPLSLGRCEGDHLRCMYHGLLYDRGGRVVEIPGQDLVPPRAQVRAYPVIERHSWVWVWMGTGSGDPDLIPPAVGLDHPDYILGHGQLDYAAEARLINDNLLDFSHLSYVHATSFSASETWARSRPSIRALERGVRFERWIRGERGTPARTYPVPVDRYSTYDFLVPGVLLMASGVFPDGTADALDGAAPDLAQADSGVTFTSQAVTPMTAKSSRYFFSWGPHRAHGDAALRDMLMEMAGRAFAEDRTMIEAQQRVIDATPDPRVLPTRADAGIALYARLAERLSASD